MNLVSLSSVSFAFDGQIVLENVNIAIKPHDFIVLRGTNGGGKTTLLRLLAGLLRPTKGEIRRASGLHIGYLPQYRKIDRQFPLRVCDVVRSGLQNRKKLLSRFSPDADDRVREALHQLAIEQLAARPISDLSGGQWQRVLLARAIVPAPTSYSWMSRIRILTPPVRLFCTNFSFVCKTTAPSCSSVTMRRSLSPTFGR